MRISQAKDQVPTSLGKINCDRTHSLGPSFRSSLGVNLLRAGEESDLVDAHRGYGCTDVLIHPRVQHKSHIEKIMLLVVLGRSQKLIRKCEDIDFDGKI